METPHIHILQTPTRYIKATHKLVDHPSQGGKVQEVLIIEPSQVGFGFQDEHLITAWVGDILQGSDIQALIHGNTTLMVRRQAS